MKPHQLTRSAGSSRSSEPRAACSAAARVVSSRSCSCTRSMNRPWPSSGTIWMLPSTPAVPRAIRRTDEAEQLTASVGDVGGRLAGGQDHAVRREVAQLELLDGEVAVAEQKAGEHRVVRPDHAVAGEVGRADVLEGFARPCGPCSPADPALHSARARGPAAGPRVSAAGSCGPAARSTFPDPGLDALSGAGPERGRGAQRTPGHPTRPTTGRSAGGRRARTRRSRSGGRSSGATNNSAQPGYPVAGQSDPLGLGGACRA